MPILKFELNVPIELHLRSIEGKPVDSKFGPQQQFTAEEGIFYVSEMVGAILTDQLRKLRVRAGDLVEIIKAEVTNGGRKKIQWQVAQISYTHGEQADGTLAVPKGPSRPEPPSDLERQLAASIAQVEQRKQAQQAQTAAPAWSTALVEQTCVLVDAFAQVVRHSAQYQGLVKPDDVRSILLSAFINISKSSNGGRNAA